MSHVVDVEYVSVWDDGYEIETTAKYDTLTGEVFEIGSADTFIEDANGEKFEVEVLENEYIRLADGRELEVELDDDKNAYYVI